MLPAPLLTPQHRMHFELDIRALRCSRTLFMKEVRFRRWIKSSPVLIDMALEHPRGNMYIQLQLGLVHISHFLYNFRLWTRGDWLGIQ